ncbi:MAG: hypothetical protein ACM3JD_09020, partial [Rudaea sp.]
FESCRAPHFVRMGSALSASAAVPCSLQPTLRAGHVGADMAQDLLASACYRPFTGKYIYKL